MKKKVKKVKNVTFAKYSESPQTKKIKDKYNKMINSLEKKRYNV